MRDVCLSLSPVPQSLSVSSRPSRLVGLLPYDCCNKPSRHFAGFAKAQSVPSLIMGIVSGLVVGILESQRMDAALIGELMQPFMH